MGGSSRERIYVYSGGGCCRCVSPDTLFIIIEYKITDDNNIHQSFSTHPVLSQEGVGDSYSLVPSC